MNDFTCGNCQIALAIPDKLLGQIVTCYSCRGLTQIPSGKPSSLISDIPNQYASIVQRERAVKCKDDLDLRNSILAELANTSSRFRKHRSLFDEMIAKTGEMAQALGLHLKEVHPPQSSILVDFMKRAVSQYALTDYLERHADATDEAMQHSGLVWWQFDCKFYRHPNQSEPILNVRLEIKDEERVFGSSTYPELKVKWKPSGFFIARRNWFDLEKLTGNARSKVVAALEGYFKETANSWGAKGLL